MPLPISGDEKNAYVTDAFIDSDSSDVVIPLEAFIFFTNDPAMLGFYSVLRFLIQKKLIHFLKQKDVADLLGLTETTYIKKKRELEQLGLLEVASSNNTRKYKIKAFTRLASFKTTRGYALLKDYLNKLRSTITIEKSEEVVLTPEKVEKVKEVKEKFPVAWYNQVIASYMKNKGVTINGPEVAGIRKAIKTMFLAGRKPEDIMSCMGWFKDHEKDDKYSWVRSWTIWTVQKKLPEFLAGKLEIKERTMLDDYPDL